MGLSDKILGKAMGQTIPKLTAVLESLHGFMRLNALINQQIWIESMRKRNPTMTEQEARDITDEQIEIFEKNIENSSADNTQTD